MVGSHSDVWRHLQPRLAGGDGRWVAIGHGELDAFRFLPTDRVWLLSYARSHDANLAMLRTLERAGVAEIVYVSSSSTIVAERTRCYGYPRVKRDAERAALRLPNARVLTLGLMHVTPSELPPGPCVATSYDELAQFVREPSWPARREEAKALFRRHDRPFQGRLEQRLHQLYGVALRACGAYPCLMRPMDVLLRALGMRWYGYVYLSNALWTAKTS